MARTSDTLIKEVIETDADVSTFDPFIRTANVLVDEFCLDAGYTTQRLTDIETWLAAHFYTVRDPRSIKSKSLDAEDWFKFESTYLETALALDSKGKLRAHFSRTKKGKAGVAWMGKE